MYLSQYTVINYRDHLPTTKPMPDLTNLLGKLSHKLAMLYTNWAGAGTTTMHSYFVHVYSVAQTNSQKVKRICLIRFSNTTLSAIPQYCEVC